MTANDGWIYQRIQKANAAIEALSRVPRSKSAKDPKPLESVLEITGKIARDPLLESLAESLESKAKVFDRLRFAMRIALPENGEGINDDGKGEDMESIKSRVTVFRNWLAEDPEKRKTYSKMLKQLDKYWEKLFADPLPVETAEGTVYIQPQRTNNVLERFFRGEKRLGRKKTGTASLNKLIKATLADTPLVRNLKNEDYLDMILCDCSSLAERFARIAVRQVRSDLEKSKNSNEKMSPAIRKCIKKLNLIEKNNALFMRKAI